MISRIYVWPAGIRGDKYKFICYTIEHQFSNAEIKKAAAVLTNPILEEFSIDIFPKIKNFTYAVEIGYLPGVTDNLARTSEETITDLLGKEKTQNLRIFSSRIFLIKKKINKKEAEQSALSLHNPLVERASIISREEIKKVKSLPSEIPSVALRPQKPVIKVPLEVNDAELEKIGKLGIVGEEGERRGPLALNQNSMRAIKDYFAGLGREPNDIELESLAQTWSEHCKHTIFANPIDANGLQIKDGLYKTYIKEATNLIRKKKGKADFCVSVFSDNSGGIIFDDQYLITHKVETHNSPSALDPFGGAITGIVGVNRDTIGFGLGAKPIANTYGFCFGEPEDKRILCRALKSQPLFPPRRIMEGVVHGINVGGNCSGIPTTTGFIKFDERYRGKPLVFAGTVGLIPRKINGKYSHIKKAEPGNYIVVLGGRVGLDGIHGATFSSVSMDSHSPSSAVQIGDPITQKKLSDCLVKEARGMDLYSSITDNGAGGLSCSVAEMAKESGGASVDLEKVPLKYPGLRPWEIWISESQERMTLSVPKKNWPLLRRLMASRGVEASVIGTFTDSDKMIVKYNGKTIMDIGMDFLHNGLPQEHLRTEKIKKIWEEPVLPQGKSRTKILLELLRENNVSGFSFISQQYDHEVQASSAIKPLSGRGRINTDAQALRPVLSSRRGIVLSAALYPSYGDISAYQMAACAIDTAIRNTVAAGGSLKHLALLDNFCWSSSDEPSRLYQLVEALKACYKYAVGYGTPFISGKDSMFNDFRGYDEKGRPIHIAVPPTLLISAIGVIEDVYKSVSPEFKNVNDVIYLLGETDDELGGGEYYKLLAKKQGNDAIGNNVPKVDLEKNLKTYQAMENAIEKELLSSALSITSGGLAVALTKACVGGILGCNVSLAEVGLPQFGGSPTSAIFLDAKLFSESQGRVLVSISPKNVAKFKKIVKNIPYAKLGKVTKNSKVIVAEGKNKIIDTTVKKLHAAYHSFSKKYGN